VVSDHTPTSAARRAARALSCTGLALLTLLAAAALVRCPIASAASADEAALAERYAPVVRLVAQAKACGYGESYEPIDVDLLLDEPTVALRGPWGRDLVKIGPGARDLSAQRFEYHLDFPGNALDPRCDYERWSRRLTEGHRPAVYAHVATDPGFPGKLSLQYWLYYVFNDWNNTHEGDWEMIQLVFDAASAREALSRQPVEVGYSQHEGAERATWGDDKLEVVGGTHPVVHPAAGSHANFYEEALHLGSSASEGVGCDDTTGPTYEIQPSVHTIPSDPSDARAAFPWIAFEGRWGELQPAFFNGPTGPNLKGRWTQPIGWSEDWRGRSFAVPAGGALGTGATDFFCEAVGAGSNALRRAADDPLPVVGALLALLVLVAFALARATWRPAAPLRLARRRAWGQTLAAAAQMYAARLPLFLGIGLILLPISVVTAVLRRLVIGAASVVGIEAQAEAGGVLVLVALAIAATLTLVGLVLVQAATTCALIEIDAGRPIRPLGAYRLALVNIRPLLGATLILVVAWLLLSISVLLIPVAIWLVVRCALLAQVVELERRTAFGALRRSFRLVRGRWLKVGSLVVVSAVVAVAAGPLFGALLILLTDAPLGLLNVVTGLVYTVAMPFVALTTAYVYFDTRARDELASEREPAVLPAEIELST
jgi:hypothetical protein